MKDSVHAGEFKPAAAHQHGLRDVQTVHEIIVLWCRMVRQSRIIAKWPASHIINGDILMKLQHVFSIVSLVIGLVSAEQGSLNNVYVLAIHASEEQGLLYAQFGDQNGNVRNYYTGYGVNTSWTANNETDAFYKSYLLPLLIEAKTHNIPVTIWYKFRGGNYSMYHRIYAADLGVRK